MMEKCMPNFFIQGIYLELVATGIFATQAKIKNKDLLWPEHIQNASFQIFGVVYSVVAQWELW